MILNTTHTNLTNINSFNLFYDSHKISLKKIISRTKLWLPISFREYKTKIGQIGKWTNKQNWIKIRIDNKILTEAPQTVLSNITKYILQRYPFVAAGFKFFQLFVPVWLAQRQVLAGKVQTQQGNFTKRTVNVLLSVKAAPSFHADAERRTAAARVGSKYQLVIPASWFLLVSLSHSQIVCEPVHPPPPI